MVSQAIYAQTLYCMIKQGLIRLTLYNIQIYSQLVNLQRWQWTLCSKS